MWRASAILYIPITIYATKEYKQKKYRVDIVLHFKNNQEIDVDNCLKTVLDMLTGHFMWDDRQIKELSVKIVENSPNMGVDITQTEI